jgi:hypothetical protein
VATAEDERELIIDELMRPITVAVDFATLGAALKLG